MIHEYSEIWTPYTHWKTGELITISWDQVTAIQHCVQKVDDLRKSALSRRGGAEHYPPIGDDFYGWKSRALGRLLVDGKPLFKEIPPYDFGAANYVQWDIENGQ